MAVAEVVTADARQVLATTPESPTIEVPTTAVATEAAIAQTAHPESAKSKKPTRRKVAKVESDANSAEAKVKKRSALDAAAQVLAEAEQAMTCQELIVAMATRGLWSSPNGRTPASTLDAAIARAITTKGKDARFVKTERGKFALTSGA
jgi:hypothetical protein